MKYLYELKETLNKTTGKIFYYIKRNDSGFVRVSESTLKDVKMYGYNWGRFSCLNTVVSKNKTEFYMTVQTPSKVFSLIGHKTLDK